MYSMGMGRNTAWIWRLEAVGKGTGSIEHRGWRTSSKLQSMRYPSALSCTIAIPTTVSSSDPLSALDDVNTDGADDSVYMCAASHAPAAPSTPTSPPATPFPPTQPPSRLHPSLHLHPFPPRLLSPPLDPALRHPLPSLQLPHSPAPSAIPLIRHLPCRHSPPLRKPVPQLPLGLPQLPHSPLPSFPQRPPLHLHIREPPLHLPRVLRVRDQRSGLVPFARAVLVVRGRLVGRAVEVEEVAAPDRDGHGVVVGAPGEGGGWRGGRLRSACRAWSMDGAVGRRPALMSMVRVLRSKPCRSSDAKVGGGWGATGVDGEGCGGRAHCGVCYYGDKEVVRNEDEGRRDRASREEIHD